MKIESVHLASGLLMKKSLLWDSSWSGEQFYGNFKENLSIKKASSGEVFDSITAEFNEGLENVHHKTKNLKNLKAKKKETKLVVKVEAFLWKTL